MRQSHIEEAINCYPDPAQYNSTLYAGSQDFMPVDLRMEFPPGTDRQSVSLSIIDDNQVEQFEFFMLKAVIVNGNSSNDPTASIIIQDNDSKYK